MTRSPNLAIHLPLARLRPLLLVVAMLSGLACSPPRTPPPTQTPAPVYSLARPDELPRHIRIDLLEARGYAFAEMHLNHKPAGLFLIDTGATIAVVERGLASRMELPTLGSGTTLGIGGTERFAWVGVESLSFTDVVELPARRAASLSLHRTTEGMGVPVNGIVGYPSFGSVPFTLDLSRPVLILHRRDAFAQLDKPRPIRLVTFRGLPVVEATLGDAEDPLVVWLIIDTGAHAALTLPRELRTRWPQVLAVPEHGMGRTRGVGGTVASTSTWVKQLNVLGVSLKDVPTNFEAPPAELGATPAPVGRIGHGLLRQFQLTFDRPNNVVYPLFLGDGGGAAAGPDNAAGQ